MMTLLAKITSMLSLEANDIWRLCAGLLVVICGAICLTVAVVSVVRRKKRKNAQDGQQAEQQDTLTQEQAYIEANDKGQIVMSRNVIYSAGLNGQIRVGKYMLTSADESQRRFNVRYNGLVKEYADGDVLTLTDGDTISPVSGSVVLACIED